MEKNRRDFLRDLGLGLSAMVFAPKIIKPTFRDTLRFNRASVCEVVNPAWIEAPYEIEVHTYRQCKIADSDDLFIWSVNKRFPDHDVPSWVDEKVAYVNKFSQWGRVEEHHRTRDPIPMRLNWDKTYIPPYIET